MPPAENAVHARLIDGWFVKNDMKNWRESNRCCLKKITRQTCQFLADLLALLCLVEHLEMALHLQVEESEKEGKELEEGW